MQFIKIIFIIDQYSLYLDTADDYIKYYGVYKRNLFDKYFLMIFDKNYDKVRTEMP